jgi:hypothetical protein
MLRGKSMRCFQKAKPRTPREPVDGLWKACARLWISLREPQLSHLRRAGAKAILRAAR